MNPAPLEVRRISGRMPSLWNRRVIFVANLLGLFFGNDQETGVLRSQVGPLETYGGRLVPILDLLFHGPGPNLLVLERRPDPELIEYFRSELGLRLPEIDLLPHESYRSLARKDPRTDPGLDSFLDRLRAHGGEWLDGFVTDAVLERLASLLNKKTVSCEQASRLGNNKLLLHQHLARAGLPVFDTYVAADLSEVHSGLAALRNQGYQRAAVKAQIGASGIGIVKVHTHNPGDIPAYLFFEGPCLVQGWLDDRFPGIKLVGSPSVQLFLDEHSLSLYDLTEQILSADSIHEGNTAPPPWLGAHDPAQEQLLAQAELTGRWLHAQGYRGTASVDFHLVQRNGRREMRVCEINARVTGATYPSLLARHFRPDGAWLMRNMRFANPLESAALLRALDEANLLFRPGTKPGIVPINFNTNQAGRVVKGQFLCLSDTTDQAWAMFAQARTLLPLQGEFDRD